MNASADPSAPLVVFDRVSKQYGNQVVLDQLSFTIARNEFVVLTGSEGAGKSTVFRLIAALERPSAGIICISGLPLARIARRGLPLLRRSLGFLAQEPQLLSDYSAIENVALPLVAAGVPKREARSRAMSALQRVGLDKSLAAAVPPQLSGGARRRIAWARALVNRPALLLLDEPMAGLGDESETEIRLLLEQVLGSGATVLVASREVGAVLSSGARIVTLSAKGRGR